MGAKGRTMTLPRPAFAAAPCVRFALVALAALLALPAQALFKVVNPDGSISYSDRPPPPTTNARVTQMGRPGVVSDPDQALPAELRTPVQRHPVTLYTTTECAPCDAGRQLLVTRGIPYNERRVLTEEDAQAYERLFGTRTLPLVTIGPQPLRGLSDSDWHAYLDAAGYPRQSRLPRGWPQPTPSPMVERSAPTPAPATVSRQRAPAAAEPAAESGEESPSPSRVRF